MTKNLGKSKCFWLLFLLLLFPFLIFLFPTANSLTMFFNYEDSPWFGVDYPVAGIDYEIFATPVGGVKEMIAIGTTDSTGLITIMLLEDYEVGSIYMNYVDLLGVMDNYNYLTQDYTEFEISTKSIDSLVLWSHDLTPVISMTYDLYYDGSVLTTLTTDEFGQLTVSGLIVGNYTFENALIEILKSTDVYSEDIVIDATTKLISGFELGIPYLSNEGKALLRFSFFLFLIKLKILRYK